ncbi:NINE protein [Synechococcus sp. JA-3-3Ab]|uniref:NINE protein n=1 Tax=Synechococcus sp. (strain JA-3-3Ab) TaxID=321327 RepID=UPI000069495E|nr:TM2 domain-containing protein [Synechococcus sp. JA-3-3Ab]ABD00989.1 TM2 domain protein [Synechococcus sp. JA-3-3Ab]
MGSQDRAPPSGTEEPQSDRSRSSDDVLLQLTVRGSRQQVLQGLRAWLELSLLTPEHFRLLVEQYRLEGEEPRSAAVSPSDEIPARLGSAYVLWILGLFGICGLHRFYLGRWRTGLLWLLTFGLLGIGQLLDLIWIPGMVRERNARLAGSGVEEPAVEGGEEPQAAPQSTRATRTESLPPPTPALAVLLRNLLSELSVAWLLLLGLFLVVVSSGVLAASHWEQFSPTAQYGVLLAYTAAFGVGAGWIQRQEGLRLTGQTLEAIALLLVPVNVWALDGLGILWGIRILALGLLLGIPLAAGRQVRSLGSGAGFRDSGVEPNAFYGTLVNFLALSGLHAFWSLGPQELRPAFVLGILYLGILSTVIYTWSRRSRELRGSKIWLIGAAGSLLILRGLLSGHVQVPQLGLAVALLGWLAAEWPQGSPDVVAEGAQEGMLSRWWEGSWVLLVVGWLLAAIGLAESPFSGWQLLGISLLGIHVLIGRLRRHTQSPQRDEVLRVHLTLLFLLGLETCWAFWQVWPASWRQEVVATVTNWFQPLDSPWGLLGLALLPYEVLWLGLAARWQRSGPEAGETGFSGLVEPTERLVLGLGGSLLLLSLPYPAIRFWHLLLSAGILAWWLQQKSRSGETSNFLWVLLTHAYGVGALLAGIRWLLPDLFAPAVRSTSLSAWGVVLLLVGLLQWAGRVALGGSGRFWGLPVGLWQRSADGIGLVLVGSSYLAFLLQRFLDSSATGEQSMGWLWLLVPLVLTAAQVLALPPLEFMPRWLQIPEQGEVGFLSWRQGIPERGSLRFPAVLSLLLAQLLTFGRPGVEFLGLGLGLLLMATQVWVWASFPSADHELHTANAVVPAEVLLTVTFGWGFGLVGIHRLFPALTESEWLTALGVLLLFATAVRSTSGCRYSLGTPFHYLSPRLRAAYRPVLDGFGFLLGIVLLLSLTLQTLQPEAGRIGGGKYLDSPVALTLASGTVLVAIVLRLWVEVAPAFYRDGGVHPAGLESESPSPSRAEDVSTGGSGQEASSAISWSVMEGLSYGLIWALELLVASSLLWVVRGSRPVAPLLAVINLSLGILFWIGPEKLLFERPDRAGGTESSGGQLLQRVKALSCWGTAPLIYAGLGWLGSHLELEWSELTGLGSLGLSIVLLGVGRRQSPEQHPCREQEGPPPTNRKGILGAFGISLAAYESWVYFLGQQTGEFWEDEAAVLTALLGLLLAVGYCLCPSWLVATLRLKAAWLQRIGAGNWGLASLALWSFALSPWGKGLWVLTGSGLVAYAAGQARTSTLESPTERNWVPTVWGYLSAWQGAGVLLGGVFLGLPQLSIARWAGSLLCGLGLVYHGLPWRRWGWPAAPWQNTALVLPLAAFLVTAGGNNTLNLLLGATYYALLAIWRSQVRLGYVSLFLSNWILWSYGWHQDWASLTFYALPLVGSLLYVAQVDPGLQEASGRQGRHWLRLVSLGTWLLVVMVETHGQRWTGFWPVGLGLALGLLGLALRVRAYLFVGTLAFGLGILRQGWLLVTTDALLLWATGILLGLLLIWTAANLERRREEVGSRLSAWLGQLQSWE